MVIDNNFYMNLALNEAWKYQGLTYPNPAVGCCIIGKYGEILSVEAHKKAGTPHAEVNALQYAYFKLTNDKSILELTSSHDIHDFLIKKHNGIFEKCSLYTTLEPCSHIGKTPSCANLISVLGIKKLYVGSIDSNKAAAGGNVIVQKSGIDVECGILKDECDLLLEPFNRWIDKRFVFFKWAQRLNGSTKSGVISTKNSRENVHAMRDVCDLLVIGGNTVRVDRPTLDARLINGKAPDILIISKSKEFDKTIPLFNVDGRKVFIESDFEKLKEYKNIMIEGSEVMFELSKEFVNTYLCYLSPTMDGNDSFKNIFEKFSYLNIRKEEADIIVWMKREGENG
ncbi:MAG: bifunctional diaminohydroxyphosphoribosylaminopyrimidine deaminase/5-amino-6-(5-phosphoribosylamino)uracil reductase RibD [Campylobacterales bacterium]|nr:bifunctional diaminohydroxyphosphoribosylaminopyrimidine deaminase/5-amino-6-(5-phosphoribosylamino)uracil reductase RibD [Campylobacterales bacterium]